MAKDKASAKILIADPHETSRHVISIMLHKLGYLNVFEAADSVSADAVIKQHTRSNAGMSSLLGGAAPGEVCDLDLVILDADLTPEAGLVFLKRLRSKFKADQAAVLFTAMRGKDEPVSMATGAGANDVMVKPFTQDSFGVKVELLCGTERAPVIRAFSLSIGDKPFKPSMNIAKKKKEEAKQAEPIAVKVSGNSAPVAKKGGSSFISRVTTVSYSTDGPPTAQIVNGEINGHYHEQVNVIGGGQNCYWARKHGEDAVRLEYLSAKGTPSGIEAKIIPLEQFMYTFYLCDSGNCAIMARLKNE